MRLPFEERMLIFPIRVMRLTLSGTALFPEMADDAATAPMLHCSVQCKSGGRSPKLTQRMTRNSKLIGNQVHSNDHIVE